MSEDHHDSSASPQPASNATLLLLVGLLITSLFSAGTTANELANSYAIGVGLSLALCFAVDYRGNIRNLIRTDIMALSSLYFLTLAEFLIPQPQVEAMITLRELEPALTACLIGIAAVAVGRHFSSTPSPQLLRLTGLEPPRHVIIILFTVCFALGFINMLMAVEFDVKLMIDYFMAPRFSQPWGRGRFGDWRALLYELSMVLYLVPPIAGVVLAGRNRYSGPQIIYVGLAFLFTLFYGFTSGTRNIFATYLATFLVAFAFAAGRERRKEVMVVISIASAAMLYATTAMLEFRGIGFYAYTQGVQEFEGQDNDRAFFVDNNLVVIARLMDIFPRQHDYLGFEIPYLALVRPIPRALWSGKPEGMSISIEDALGGDENYTLAASFVGEAYMSGGYLGVVLFGLFFGVVMCWWNKLGREDNSPFGYLLYASGFFAAVISMRSLFVFTTAILPTVAAIVFGNWAIQNGLARRRRHHEEANDQP